MTTESVASGIGGRFGHAEGLLCVRYMPTVSCDEILNIKARMTEETPPLFRLKAELTLGGRRRRSANRRRAQRMIRYLEQVANRRMRK